MQVKNGIVTNFTRKTGLKGEVLSLRESAAHSSDAGSLLSGVITVAVVRGQVEVL